MRYTAGGVYASSASLPDRSQGGGSLPSDGEGPALHGGVAAGAAKDFGYRCVDLSCTLHPQQARPGASVYAEICRTSKVERQPWWPIQKTENKHTRRALVKYQPAPPNPRNMFLVVSPYSPSLSTHPS